MAGLTGLALASRPLQAIPHLVAPRISRRDFGPDFTFGAAAAAYQIEGAWNLDGKGPSVWDAFTHRNGKIKDRSNGDTACDFYHRYPDDIRLAKGLGIQHLRLSTAWSRILPEGKGKVNQAGLDFYDRVVDSCLENGVVPWLTLYHWDLPQALEDAGGWRNRDVVNWFSDYADLTTRRLGDRVKNWMVLNEPMAFVGLGYMLGMHAPGKKGPFKFLKAAHHATLAQAAGGRVVRANVPGAHIGTTFSMSHVTPRSEHEKDLLASRKVDALWNRLFLEPALGLGYPEKDFPLLKHIERYTQPGDMESLAFDFDFIGLQNYTREVIKKAFVPFLGAKFIPPAKRGVPPENITEMGWEVYPEGIYQLLKKLAAYPQIKKIIVTENGAAFPDKVEGNEVKDNARQSFLQSYLGEVLKAKQEGVPVNGYFVWTLMDNFEWAEGYRPRFGLIHVDFETQKRTVKQSGLWYRDFLSEH